MINITDKNKRRRKIKSNKFIIPKIFFIVIFAFLYATSYAQFGKNKVQYKIFDWKYIQSTHFDVYFDKGDIKIAEYAAQVAENSLASLSKSLDYNINNRIPIIVFNSHNEFQQNNVLDEFLPEGVGGVTELFKNRILVPFEGNYQQFRHVIHHELLHGFFNDMFYGGSIQNIISKNITLNIPLWFSEGMAEYQSLNGLDKNTDMFIRDAVLNNYLPPIDYNDGYLAYRGGQSFFSFLSDTYGDVKFGDLMSNIRGLGDVDLAFQETYKLDLEKLNEKWQKYLKKQHYPEVAIREDIKDIGKMLTNHREDGGFYNIAPTISPQGNQFAFISNRDDFFSVFIADIKNGKILDKVIEGNNTNNFEELQVLTPGLSYSPDGKQLAISVKSGANDAIYLIDINSGDERKFEFNLKSISYVRWSPFKNILAFIGSNGSQSDLYTYDISTRTLSNLTNDIFSDFSPSWSPDGQSIYFSSDRGEYLNSSLIPENFKMYERNPNIKDIYSINVSSREIKRITNTTNTNNSYVNFSADGSKMLYVSDKNGITNIYEGSYDSTGLFSERPITNSLSPIDQISLSKDNKKLLFVSLNEGGYDIFSMDNPLDRRVKFDTLPPTQFVLQQQNELNKNTSSRNMVDSLRENMSDTLLTLIDSLAGINKHSNNLTDTLRKNDSLNIYGDDIKIKFNNKDTTKYTKFIDTSYKNNKNFKVTDNFNTDSSFKVKDYKIKFTPDIVYGNAAYSSYYGVQGVAQLSFSDMLGNHRFTILTSMVIDLKNSDYAVGYQYLPKRIDYGFDLYHTARFVLYDNGYGNGSQLYRYRTIGGDINASYPINRFKRIDGGIAVMRISRENLDNANEEIRQKYLIVPSLSFVHDNTLFGYLYPEKGSRYNITALASPRLGEKGSEFYTIMGDFRKYFKIGENYSFAMRFDGAASFGANPQRFYLGGVENWINWTFENDVVPFGESIENYSFASLVTPLRGYNFNARSGSKYVLGNLELRFPLFRYLILGALPLGFQNIMGNIFLDVGTAWSNTKKLQLISRSGSSNSIITKDLLMAPGLGARIVLFGFPVRFDVAWNYNLQKFSGPKYYFSLGLDY